MSASPPHGSRRGERIAQLALFAGLLSIPVAVALPVLGAVLALLGIAAGWHGRRLFKRKQAQSDVAATWGIILGAIGLATLAIFLQMVVSVTRG